MSAPPRPATARLALVGAMAGAAMFAPGLSPIAHAALVSDPASLVNPFIGTSNGADDFPGADTPFGMAQWSPDTPSRPAGGGYEHGDSSITGFSLTHLSGPGCGAEGDVPILPTVGAVNVGETENFSHKSEKASAGYYQVTLANGVETQLTATTRTGMARFTFPSTNQANLIFKLNSSQNGDSNTQFNVVSNTEVTGQVTSGGFCGAGNSYTVYFDMVFNTPFASNGTQAVPATQRHAAKPAPARAAEAPNKPTLHGKTTTRGAKPTAPHASANDGYVTFDTTGNPVVDAKVGISFVSLANAAQNLTTENSGWDFSSTQAAAHSAWNSLLTRIQIAGGSAKQRAVFYTAMYHALLHPNVMSDVNGQYPGFDGNVQTVDSGHFAAYGNYSGWDIYRSQAQLEALIDPSAASDTAQSMIDDYAQTGQFPKWSEDNGETYVMVGDPADPILADYYSFGARDFDTSAALNDMIAEGTNTNNNRPGLNYLTGGPGYLPADGTYDCCNFYGEVSTQLEYDTADYAIASMANQLGDSTDYTSFATRSQNWENVFNPASGFMQPKLMDGSWASGFDPASFSNDFVEGTSWMYTGMVPFNLAGLIAADGGAANYNSTYLNPVLKNFLGQGGSVADLTNEPSLDLPWQYDYTGEPYQTQNTIRRIQNNIWKDTPGGLAGNDDLGTMSAWYVWSALGMYPETPGTPSLALGSPLFSNAVVTLPSGNTLTIVGNGAADNAPYVQSASWNGSDWNNAYAPTDAIANGGTLTYNLGTTANTSWASGTDAAPPSDPTGEQPLITSATPGSGLVIAPGASGTGSVVATNLSGSDSSVAWTASAPTGVSVNPSGGTFTASAQSTDKQSITVTAGNTEGSYPITFSFSSGGAALPSATLNIAVAKPGELWPYYTNTAVSDDNNQTAADFDGGGFSYSSAALAGAGLSPGGTVTSGGITYTWPDAASGQPDNVEAEGQTIPMSPITGATGIGLLGSATQAIASGGTGTLTVNFTDGTTQKIPIALADWTLGAGKYPALASDTTVATMSYRNAGGNSQTVNVYVFSTEAPLTAGKTVSSITLPASPSDGDVHVFAIGFAGGSAG